MFGLVLSGQGRVTADEKIAAEDAAPDRGNGRTGGPDGRRRSHRFWCCRYDRGGPRPTVSAPRARGTGAGSARTTGLTLIAASTAASDQEGAQPPIDGPVYDYCQTIPGLVDSQVPGMVPSANGKNYFFPDPWIPPTAKFPQLNSSTFGETSGLTSPAVPVPASLEVAGFANAGKLNESALLGPAPEEGSYPAAGFESRANSDVFGYSSDPTDPRNTPGSPEWGWYECQIDTGQLSYLGLHEFPPVRATFLAFGFMPVTATVTLTEATGPSGLVPVTEVAYQLETLVPPANDTLGTPGNPFVVTATAEVTLSLSDVTVDGSPLAVGDCHTTEPLYTPGSPADPGKDLTVLTGGSTSPYPAPLWGGTAGIFGGGALAGEVTIPPFTGCVTPAGENLDSLFDATVSGPGNYLHMVAGPVCANSSNHCATPQPPPATSPGEPVPPTPPYR